MLMKVVHLSIFLFKKLRLHRHTHTQPSRILIKCTSVQTQQSKCIVGAACPVFPPLIAFLPPPPRPQLGGWAVSGQWNRTDFNSTLSTLMRDYATFPFFGLQVGQDPKEMSSGTPRRYIQARTRRHDDDGSLLWSGAPGFIDSCLLFVNRLISLIC